MTQTMNSIRNKVAIVGVGESDIGKVPTMSGLGLNAQAARRALDDSGLKLSDIDGVLTAYSFTEPYFMLGSVLCEYLGIKPRYTASMIVGGASPAVMLKHAAEAITAGHCQTVLVCAGENRATGQSRDQAVAALVGTRRAQRQRRADGRGRVERNVVQLRSQALSRRQQRLQAEREEQQHVQDAAEVDRAAHAADAATADTSALGLHIFLPGAAPQSKSAARRSSTVDPSGARASTGLYLRHAGNSPRRSLPTAQNQADWRRNRLQRWLAQPPAPLAMALFPGGFQNAIGRGSVSPNG